MKTYLKGIKTVAVIFLSLSLFSCQEEQIEPIDTLSTAPNQLMQKPDKGSNSGRVNYTVSLGTGEILLENLLVTEGDCFGTCNNTQTLLWFSSDCSTSFDTGTEFTDLNLVAIRLDFDDNKSGVHMTDGSNTYFSDPEWDCPELIFDPAGGTYVIYAKINMYKKIGKGKHRIDEYAGFVSIGKIVITKL